MKVSEIRKLSEGDLEKTLREKREELFRLRFRLATRQLDNYAEIVKTKRDIARFLTIRRQRSSAAMARES